MPLADDNWKYRDKGFTDDSGFKDLEPKEYAELSNGPTERVDQESGQRKRLYLCNWDERAQFYDSLMGYSSIKIGGVDRNHPDLYPEGAGYYCSAVEMVGRGIPGVNPDVDIGTRKYAQVSAEYTPLPYGIGDDDWDYYSTKITKIQEFLQTPGSLRYADSAPATAGNYQIIDTRPGILVSYYDVKLTWHRVPGRLSDPYANPVQQTALDLMGTVNLKPVQLKRGGRLYAKGTVLFLGLEDRFVPSRLHQDSGTYRTQWDVMYSFKVIDNGPGYILTAGSPTAIAADSNGNTERAGHNFRFKVPSTGSPTGGYWVKATYSGDPAGDVGNTLYDYKDFKMDPSGDETSSPLFDLSGD